MLISRFNFTDMNKITNFEQKHGFVFPELYRDFLITYNGGRTPKTKFRINKISSDIRGFYGLGDSCNNLSYNFLEKMNVLEENLENGMFPIAVNSFGDYICIGVANDNHGKIYFIYHDRPINYIEIAEDFRIFVSKCKSQKIGHIRTIEERKQALIANGFGDKITPEKIAGWQSEIDLYANIHQEELII